MLKKSLLLLAVLVLVGTTGFGAEDVEIAVVDYGEVTAEVLEDGEIEMLSQREVFEIGQELGYDLIVGSDALDFYLEGTLNNLVDLRGIPATEEVEEVFEQTGIMTKKDEIEDWEELVEEPEVKDITDEIIEEIE